LQIFDKGKQFFLKFAKFRNFQPKGQFIGLKVIFIVQKRQ